MCEFGRGGSAARCEARLRLADRVKKEFGAKPLGSAFGPTEGRARTGGEAASLKQKRPARQSHAAHRAAKPRQKVPIRGAAARPKAHTGGAAARPKAHSGQWNRATQRHTSAAQPRDVT